MQLNSHSFFPLCVQIIAPTNPILSLAENPHFSLKIAFITGFVVVYLRSLESDVFICLCSGTVRYSEQWRSANSHCFSEIPLLPTISAKVTFQKLVFRDDLTFKMFKIPKSYREDANRFPDL